MQHTKTNSKDPEIIKIQKDIYKIIENSQKNQKEKQGSKEKIKPAATRSDVINQPKDILGKLAPPNAKVYEIEIPFKIPSLNQYINAARAGKSGKYIANEMKQQYTKDIIPYIKDLPKFKKVAIEFLWTERR